jgi:hypothetical protein
MLVGAFITLLGMKRFGLLLVAAQLGAQAQTQIEPIRLDDRMRISIT